MKTTFTELRSAVMVTLALAVVCCGLYPLAVFGLAQMFFHDKANGSLIVDTTDTSGLAPARPAVHRRQIFSSAPLGGGQRLRSHQLRRQQPGPTSQKLRDAIAQNVADYRTQNGLATNAPVPADAVTASASGLDPHISPQNAGTAGRARRQGPRPEPGTGARPYPAKHHPPTSAFSATPASTCCD